MDHEDSFERFLSDAYPRELFRANRIERLGDRSLSDFQFDVDTVEFLGCENVGVFVENCGDIYSVKRKLEIIDAFPCRGMWVAVMGTQTRHWVMYNDWHGLEGDSLIPNRQLPSYWLANKLIFSTPEGLRKVLRTVLDEGHSIGGIFLVDLECNIHKARGNQRLKNDRPQHVVDFRASLTRFGWAPPLVVMTGRHARSVYTDRMRLAYCLETWWYVDGTTIKFTTGDVTGPK